MKPTILFNVINDFNREAFAIDINFYIPVAIAISALDQVIK